MCLVAHLSEEVSDIRVAVLYIQVGVVVAVDLCLRSLRDSEGVSVMGAGGQLDLGMAEKKTEARAEEDCSRPQARAD